MRSLGIDIGGASVKAALLQDQKLLATSRSDPYTAPSIHVIAAAIAQAVEKLPAGPEAIGLCCPGVLDRAAATVLLSVNIPALNGMNLVDLLHSALPQLPRLPPPSILTDAAAVAYDIYQANALRGRLLCLALGTGVGASVLDDGGVFLQVAGQSAGHLGQVDVSLDQDGPLGPDGGRGSLEAYIGAAALKRQYGEANVASRLSIHDPPIQALARIIRIAHAIYRPNHVCLTGGIGIRLAHLIPELLRLVSRELTSVAREGWTLFTGEHDHHAACGIARYASRDERTER